MIIIRTKRGRYHQGSRINYSVATPEACNIDQTEWIEVPEIPEGTDPKRICRRCFKE